MSAAIASAGGIATILAFGAMKKPAPPPPLASAPPADTALTGAPPASPALGGCPVFPASNVWNQRVDTLPVESDSAQLIASIGLDSGVHADFGSGLYAGSSGTLTVDGSGTFYDFGFTNNTGSVNVGGARSAR